MTDDELLHEFVRVETNADEGVEIRVKVILWPAPHSPSSRWMVWRRLSTQPSAAGLVALKRELLRDERYFGSCRECSRRLPQGWMHSRRLCQRCATERHGVVY